MSDRVLGWAGLVVVVAALIWAVAGGGAVAVGILTVIGLLLTVVDAVIWRSSDPGLAVPDGAQLPSAPWGRIVGPAGAAGLVTAVTVEAIALGVLAGLALAACVPGAVMRSPTGALPRRVVSYARRVRVFAEAHGAEAGGPITGYLAPVGESGARLVVIAPDGQWADVMLSRANAGVVTELAQIELTEPTDSSAGRRLRIGEPFWESMTRSW